MVRSVTSRARVVTRQSIHVLTGSMDKTVRLWNAQTGQEIRRFVGHTLGIYGVAYSPDGKSVATGNGDGTARIWDAQTGQELRRFDTRAFIQVVKFSPDGKYLFSGDSTGGARLWNIDYHATTQSLCSRLLRDFFGRRAGAVWHHGQSADVPQAVRETVRR
ncbi:MAG: hypothetical protein V9G13_13895 [Marmoricola sp.]